MLNLILDGLMILMKQTKAHETKLKQPQNEVRLGLKPTPRNKKDKTMEKHRRGGSLQRKKTWLAWGMRLVRG